MSVTTDGFITDLPDLEDKLLNLPLVTRPLFTKYRQLREGLCGLERGLELKSDGVGIIS